MIFPGLARRNAGIRTVVALCVLSGLGVLSVMVATRWGPGLTPDSAVYIGGASSLLAGKGFVMPTVDAESLPISHYPPLYPALLAMVSAFGMRPMAAARLLDAILFGGNIFLVGVLVRRAQTAAGPVSSWLGAFAAFFVLTSTTMLHVHVMTWSEPAFIFFWLLGVVALLAYQRTSRRSLLFVSAACGSLALLTRYAGIPIVATTAIALLCFGRHSARRRIADVVVYVALALVPVVLWLMRNVSASGTATNRTISWQSLKTAHWAEASEAVTSWLFIPTTWLHPIVTGTILLGAAVAALSVVIADARASAQSAPGSGGEMQAGVASLLGLFAVLYVGFLCVSIMLFDHGTPLDWRILSPVFVAAVVILLHGTDLVARRWRMPLVNYALIALLGAFALRYVVGGALFVRWGYERGFGFNNATWRQSEVLREVARLPPDVVVYSNRPEPIFLHTGRPAAELPRLCHVNPRCDADIASLEPRMRARPSVIAYFRHVPRPTVLGEQELLAQLPLKVRASSTDGTIYGLDSSR